jgi:hypothetical protein
MKKADSTVVVSLVTPTLGGTRPGGDSSGDGDSEIDDFLVLAGKKPFSRQMVRKLAAYFGVDVGVLAGNL